jgi:hypothetical protein
MVSLAVAKCAPALTAFTLKNKLVAGRVGGVFGTHLFSSAGTVGSEDYTHPYRPTYKCEKVIKTPVYLLIPRGSRELFLKEFT